MNKSFQLSDKVRNKVLDQIQKNVDTKVVAQVAKNTGRKLLPRTRIVVTSNRFFLIQPIYSALLEK